MEDMAGITGLPQETVRKLKKIESSRKNGNKMETRSPGGNIIIINLKQTLKRAWEGAQNIILEKGWGNATA